MPTHTPHELWRQANGDQDKYRQLMIEHGHLVKRPPPTPHEKCGECGGRYDEHQPAEFHEFKRQPASLPCASN